MINVISLLLGLLPGFAWLFFFMQEDPDGEPKQVIAATFLIGIAFAFFALFAQIAASDYFVKLHIDHYSLIALALFALIEELFKFWAAYFSVHNSPAFDVPTDAMIYTLVAALGFATIENLAAIGSRTAVTEVGVLSTVFQTISLRFAGATLLHALTSSIVGYHWALSILRPRFKKLTLISGLVIATVVHTAFNYLVLVYGRASGGKFVYPILFVVIVGFFVLNDFDILNKGKVNIRD